MRQQRVLVGASAAIATLGIIAAVGTDEMICGSPPPGSGQRYRPKPAHHGKQPIAAADFDRLAMAEHKRLIRAAKLRAVVAAGGMSAANA